MTNRNSNLPVRQNALMVGNDMKAAAYNMGFAARLAGRSIHQHFISNEQLFRLEKLTWAFGC